MADREARLVRFSRAERWVHRSSALLMGVCLVTAFVLYYGPASLFVGHRRAVELVHVVANLAELLLQLLVLLFELLGGGVLERFLQHGHLCPQILEPGLLQRGRVGRNHSMVVVSSHAPAEDLSAVVPPAPRSRPLNSRIRPRG